MDLPRMYTDLAHWWPLLSAPQEYVEEALFYAVTIESLARRPVRDILELGSGGGNNASHLKQRWRLTLVDRSEQMLAVSRRLNPECEHLAGDMRDIRLARTFDAVLIHDAIMYMTTEADLDAAIATAAEHLAPGGVALLAPDDTAESYRPSTESGGNDGDGRAMRYLQWSHAPRGTTFSTSYVYVLREGDGPDRVEHEEHVAGLFPRATWLASIHRAGLEARAMPYLHSSFDADAGRELFAGLKT